MTNGKFHGTKAPAVMISLGSAREISNRTTPWPRKMQRLKSNPVCDGTQNVKRYRYQLGCPKKHFFLLLLIALNQWCVKVRRATKKKFKIIDP